MKAETRRELTTQLHRNGITVPTATLDGWTEDEAIGVLYWLAEYWLTCNDVVDWLLGAPPPVLRPFVPDTFSQW